MARRTAVGAQGPPARRVFFGSAKVIASLTLLVALAACPAQTPEVPPRSARDTAGAGSAGAGAGARPPRDTVLEQRVARLELRLLERDAQLEELQTRLDEARQEVVRAMAKLQTVASRAEAASALAEAEIAMQQGGPDVAQATQLLEQGTAEFGKQNYGGALYLANQAKSVAGVGKGRVDDPERAALR